MTLCGPEVFGADPIKLKWQVVRGDTATIRVEFFEDDEETKYDISEWSFVSSTYDVRGDVLDELDVTAGTGYVDITAPSDITANWGTGYSSVVTELMFDLEVTLADNTVWTPVLGTINVLGDVSGSL